MKITFLYLCLILFILTALTCKAQKTDSAGIAGIWKGTSLCQVKNSPCHDETVVYYFTKKVNEENKYSLQANKVVNRKVEDMGILEFLYDKARQTLTCNMTSRQGRTGVWLFNIDGNKIHGTLTVEDNVLYRLIEVQKSK